MGEAEQAAGPVDALPAKRVRHGWRTLDLQAEQDSGAKQVPASTALRSKNVLNVVSTTPPRIFLRAPCRLRFALLRRLADRGNPSVDFPFAGTSVHRTLVFIRLTHGHLGRCSRRDSTSSIPGVVRALATTPGEKYSLEHHSFESCPAVVNGRYPMHLSVVRRVICHCVVLSNTVAPHD